ncbi:eukaryotic rRNA processing [Cokeromyces recurvatus]|uniref:eukaryotic rRNA processing n=1 Tax=Cokeromyces recurvatus TaxID=90255 RepID=UPI002220AF0D|nr:eukaryotic rRNA processing [Cokeromyces recurvatus]KAI7902803.1 eukaryotic rRNA processing [Cokeromyces recurvatus]
MEPQHKKIKLDNNDSKNPTIDPTLTTNVSAKEEEIEPQWIRLEDLDEDDIDDEFGDMVIVQKLLVNNEQALERITEDIELKNLPWSETLSLTSKEPLQVADVFDDLLREQAFERQALEAVYLARELAVKEEKETGRKITFFKPKDFIAPMLKDDQQMEAVRQKLVAEAEDGNEEALRRLNLFDKERKKAKANERAKILKRKKKEGSEVTLEDEFNLDLEEAERLAAATNANTQDRLPKNYTRDTKDAKYSLGKKNKNLQNPLNPAKKGMSFGKKSSIKRPGKSKRQKMRDRS